MFVNRIYFVILTFIHNPNLSGIHAYSSGRVSNLNGIQVRQTFVNYFMLEEAIYFHSVPTCQNRLWDILYTRLFIIPYMIGQYALDPS